jgi:hypothetical protein
MCTVSWIHQAEGYHLFCNRDEKRTRRTAGEPRAMRRDGVRFLAPIDGDFGGTWIAVNEFGLSLVLLNGGPSCLKHISRGLLPLEWIAARTQAEAAEIISATALSRFARFSLAVLEPGSPAMLFNWDGQGLSSIADADSHMPLVSSSADPVTVERERRAEFLQLRDQDPGLRVGTLLAFHHSHQPARGLCSPCMHREDAQTVSFSWVTVTPTEVNLYYAPGPPCQSLAGESRSLPRKHSRHDAPGVPREHVTITA